jgi:PPOX class probable F420-dependent enzyme
VSQAEDPGVTASPDLVNPYAMTSAELDAFLAEPRFAAVTTLRRDGSPVQTVLGFEWDGEAMLLSLRSTRMTVKRLARDPRISIAVFNQEYPPKWVVMQGVAEVMDDPGYEATRRKMMRYMAPDSPTMTIEGLDLDEFWKGYTEVGRVFYRIVPNSILSEDGAKWGDHEQVAGAGVSDALARARGDLAAGDGR